MKLSENFYLAEFTTSQTADRLGIKNIPNANHKKNLRAVCQGLEFIRTLLGDSPITISSGYRSPELNRALDNASPTSHHMQGWAADFQCWRYGPPIQIIKAIQQSGLQYDQLIEEGSWVHISFKPTYRNQTLSADFTKEKVSYRVVEPDASAKEAEVVEAEEVIEVKTNEQFTLPKRGEINVFKKLEGWKTILGSTGLVISLIAKFFGYEISTGDVDEVIKVTLESWDVISMSALTWWGVVDAKWRALKASKQDA